MARFVGFTRQLIELYLKAKSSLAAAFFWERFSAVINHPAFCATAEQYAAELRPLPA